MGIEFLLLRCMGEGQFCRDYMETVVALMHYQFNSPEILHSWLDLFLI